LLFVADSIQKAHAYVPIQDYVNGNYLKSARVDQAAKNKTQATTNLADDNTNVIQNSTFDNFYLYPNPASDNINVVFTLPQEDLIKFNIYDMSGRSVKAVVNTFSKGENKINLDLSQLSNGIYNLKIETSRNCFNRKVIIRRNQN
jgi:CHAT domain-containing protein